MTEKAHNYIAWNDADRLILKIRSHKWTSDFKEGCAELRQLIDQLTAPESQCDEDEKKKGDLTDVKKYAALLPCPFCGSDAVLYGSNLGYSIMCQNTQGVVCDIGNTHNGWNLEAVVAMWNRRTFHLELVKNK